MLDHQESAGEADIDDRAEIFDGKVGDQPDAAETGGVDDDVEHARVVEQGPYRVFVGDVDPRGAVRIAEFGGDGVGTVGVAVRDDHPAVGRRQCMRHRLSDAGGAADDDSVAIGHSCTLSGRGSDHLAAITRQGSA